MVIGLELSGLPSVAYLPSVTERHDSDTELRSIIDEERVSILFQPIVEQGSGNVLGFEALARGPSNSPLHSPIALFAAAARTRLLFELESLCWRVACRSFLKQGFSGKLFLNTTSWSLVRGNLCEELRRGAAPACRPEQIVIEITEQFPIGDLPALLKAVEGYRSCGCEIALDDLGAGYSGLRLWSEVRPDYVKIDSHFIQGIHGDPVKQEFVRSIKGIALGTKCRVIAEGIETENELQTVASLGITFGQGYFFSRPSPEPISCFKHMARHERGFAYPLSETIAKLSIPVPFVEPYTRADAVMEEFQMNPSYETLPVVINGRPIGVIGRQRLTSLFINRYGRELHGKKSISCFMDADPLLVDHQLALEQVSQKITDDFDSTTDHDFVVTKDGNYFGMGRLRDLLKRITELQIRNARYANPLTLLPGNVPIYEQINRLIAEEKSFTVCYCDIDHFKPYNDVYGYSQGDEVIKKVAQILIAHIDPQIDFVGHIGGDDFIVIFMSDDWKERCEHILRHFSREVPALYKEEDRVKQGFESRDRAGNLHFYPLLSLSIGAASPDLTHCRSHHEVAALASSAKREAKKIAGNSLFHDRRRHPL